MTLFVNIMPEGKSPLIVDANDVAAIVLSSDGRVRDRFYSRAGNHFEFPSDVNNLPSGDECELQMARAGTKLVRLVQHVPNADGRGDVAWIFANPKAFASATIYPSENPRKGVEFKDIVDVELNLVHAPLLRTSREHLDVAEHFLEAVREENPHLIKIEPSEVRGLKPDGYTVLDPGKITHMSWDDQSLAILLRNGNRLEFYDKNKRGANVDVGRRIAAMAPQLQKIKSGRGFDYVCPGDVVYAHRFYDSKSLSLKFKAVALGEPGGRIDFETQSQAARALEQLQRAINQSARKSRTPAPRR